ncbi:thioredoxin family protein [Candidatus Gottesmanbacteria bacterium]|nr:thioredoxin family protein [Candidatus Gottesmanbacteria bacterium]
MTLTPSTMLPLGTLVPYFRLTDVVTGKIISLDDIKGKQALLVMFICRHCPYVKHVAKEIARIGRDYIDKNISIVAISSNDADSYPEDNPESLKEMAKELDLVFPLLYDPTQEVAKAFTAACTPDFFIFDKDEKLVYRGQLDGSRPGNNIPVTGKDLRGAIDDVFNHKSVTSEQKPSTGCNIKWKLGNEPTYFKT